MKMSFSRLRNPRTDKSRQIETDGDRYRNVTSRGQFAEESAVRRSRVLVLASTYRDAR
jgi:hypothetical protein